MVKFFILLFTVIFLTNCTSINHAPIIQKDAQSMPASSQIEANSIAVILPFKNKFQLLSENIKNGIRLAILNHKEILKQNNVKIRYFDEEDFELINKLKQANIGAVVGPLFGTQAAKLARELPQIKFFSFSNDWSLAQENLYIIGTGPYNVIEAIIQQANFDQAEQIYLIGSNTKTNLETIEFIHQQLNNYPDITIVKVELYNHNNTDNDFAIQSMAESLKSINSDKKAILVLLEPKEVKIQEIMDGLRLNNVDFSKFNSYTPYLININNFDDSDPFISDIYLTKFKNNIAKHKYLEYFKTLPENITIIAYDLIAELLNFTKNDLSQNENFISENFIIDNKNSKIIKRKIEFIQLKNYHQSEQPSSITSLAPDAESNTVTE